MNNQYQNQLNLQNNNSKKKKYMYIVGPLLLLIALVGVTFAFFNYTRTGLANNIGTGRIYFNSTEGNTLYLTNMFPMASNEVAGANLDSITINIVGDTTYTNGQEFKISLVDVNNTITSGSTEKVIPINYIASYERTPVATGEAPNNIGTSSNDYFTERGSTTAVYQLTAAGAVSEGEQVLVGYIPADVAVNGTLTIKAYLDGSNIAISDTYPSGDVTHTETSGETSVEIVDYTDGTTSEWVNGRTVLTTDEWNSLQNTPISFKVRAESNEGIWVEEPNKPICRRVTNVAQLHTEECSNISDYCYEDGYVVGNLGTTITYGNAKAIGSTLTKGDAFDCDVNGDGNYTERFYYVSPYFNTNTLTFDDENGYATLIYYSNTLNGVASMDNSAYDSTNENWHGPSTAKTHLPTAQQWPNISLKNTTRTILAENYSLHNQLITGNGNQTIDNPFSYSGYSARLLSAQELMNACNLTQLGKYSRSELSNCQFLFERTEYNDLHTGSKGIWLENPNGYGQIWYLLPMYRYVNTTNTNDTTNGTRPVIDVLYSKIEY